MKEDSKPKREKYGWFVIYEIPVGTANIDKEFCHGVYVSPKFKR